MAVADDLPQGLDKVVDYVDVVCDVSAEDEVRLRWRRGEDGCERRGVVEVELACYWPVYVGDFCDRWSM